MITTRKIRKFQVSSHPISKAKEMSIKYMFSIYKKLDMINKYNVVNNRECIDIDTILPYEPIEQERTVEEMKIDQVEENEEKQNTNNTYVSEELKQAAIIALEEPINQLQDEKTRLFLMLKKLLAQDQKRRSIEQAAEVEKDKIEDSNNNDKIDETPTGKLAASISSIKPMFLQSGSGGSRFMNAGTSSINNSSYRGKYNDPSYSPRPGMGINTPVKTNYQGQSGFQNKLINNNNGGGYQGKNFNPNYSKPSYMNQNYGTPSNSNYSNNNFNTLSSSSTYNNQSYSNNTPSAPTPSTYNPSPTNNYPPNSSNNTNYSSNNPASYSPHPTSNKFNNYGASSPHGSQQFQQPYNPSPRFSDPKPIDSNFRERDRFRDEGNYNNNNNRYPPNNSMRGRPVPSNFRRGPN